MTRGGQRSRRHPALTGTGAPRRRPWRQRGQQPARCGTDAPRPRPSRQRGQATVEVVAFLPLLALAGLAIMQLLAAGAAREYAGHAAEAAALAVGDGRDPTAAAREAIPGWSAHRLTVRAQGRRVHVRLRPRAILRSVGDLLAADAEADAGPRAP